VFKFVECSDGENCSKSSWKRNYRLMRRSVSANHQTSLGHPFIPVVVFLFDDLLSCRTVLKGSGNGKGLGTVLAVVLQDSIYAVLCKGKGKGPYT